MTRVLAGWVCRGTSSGLVATAVMTGTTWLEQRLRPPTDRPVDYDASSHVVTAAATLLPIQARSKAQRRALFLVVHWGYGSVVATGYELLRRRTGRSRATLAFFAASQMLAWTMFPLLGKAPPPWRWRRDVLASSLAQHAIYAATTALTDARLRTSCDR